ncbi:MAG: ribosome biogenesis GTP-binding protein YihA/YsxC [Candidatus Saccharibacteria bacterium]
MKITSATFVKGLVGGDKLLGDGKPHIAFVGRSNVGKSSVINSLVGRKDLARSSSTAGMTRQLNVFLINHRFYLVDLPGYGFAKGSTEDQIYLRRLIGWYLFAAGIEQQLIVMILDAKVGLTDLDREILDRLEKDKKNVLLVVNKTDRLKQGDLARSLAEIKERADGYRILKYSALKKIGVRELTSEIADVLSKQKHPQD